eukprot:202647_1
MEELIRFRSQIDLLSDQEFITFSKSFGRQFVCNLLFEYFLKQLINTKNYQQWQQDVLPHIRTKTCLIQKIIDSRDRHVHDKAASNNSLQEIPEKEPNQLDLDDLPTIMISHISSFLNLEDTLRFEKANRHAFIGTRSPISVHSLDAKPFTNCLSFSNENSCLYNFYRFHCIQQLSIDTETITNAFNDYFIDNVNRLPIWDRLTELSLININTYDHCRLLLETLNHEKFVGRITAFKWHGTFIDDDIYMEFDWNANIKDVFPPLHYLHLDYGLDISLSFDLSRLRGLSISNFIGGGGEYMDMLEWTCGTLESFHLSYDEQFELYAIDILSKEYPFECLREICLVFDISFHHNELMDALNTQNFNNLERIHWDMSSGLLNITAELKELMCVLLSVRSLNYLSVRCGSDTFPIAIQMICGALDGQNKCSMKIKINCTDRVLSGDETTVARNIWNLVGRLDTISNHFMLICVILDFATWGNFDTDNMYLVQTEGPSTVCISNKQCNINGYHEKWIMCCQHCNMT